LGVGTSHDIVFLFWLANWWLVHWWSGFSRLCILLFLIKMELQRDYNYNLFIFEAGDYKLLTSTIHLGLV